MRIKETPVYKYAELSDRAKERARDWFREANAGDNFFAEHITESFHEELTALGFHVDAKRWPTWSGFYSQGDGAAFAGTWYASDFAPGKLLADRPAESGGHECPSNKKLHRIAAELRECKKAGMTFAKIEGRDCYGFHMRLDECEWGDDETPNDSTPEQRTDMEDRFIQAARDLAHSFWITLRDEYEYQNSDKQIADSIEANGYEFDADGRIA